jgi:hypothetical protein
MLRRPAQNVITPAELEAQYVARGRVGVWHQKRRALSKTYHYQTGGFAHGVLLCVKIIKLFALKI